MSHKKGKSALDESIMEFIDAKIQEKANAKIKCDMLEKDVDHLNKYVELLTLQHGSILRKMDGFMDSLITRIIDDNSKLMERMHDLESKIKMLSDNFKNLETDVNAGLTNALNNDASSDSSSGNDEYMCDECKEKQGCEEITVKMGDKIINPVQLMLMKQLDKMANDAMVEQSRQEQQNDSDNEYDDTISIYDKTDKVEDDGFKELVKNINSIDDIIEFGTLKINYDISKQSDDESSYDTKKSKKTKKKQEKAKNQTENYFEIAGKKYSIDLDVVCKLVDPLKKLKKMIGMKRVKDDIFDMIIYYLQGFEQKNNAMLHTVIEGPPGVGKTRLGKIIAQIYCALGVIPSNKVKYVRAIDLIGDHIGVTKHMTQSIIDEADGGVLFIDEAYAISSDKKKDPYGQECLDTLNFNLSENKKKLIVIIAGYSEQLEKHFFSYNQGLKRRFPFRYKIDGYDSAELKDIFIDKLRKFGWKLNNEITSERLESFFKHNMNDFKNFGGDVENFFKSCQFTHSRRVLGKHPQLRKKLTLVDLNAGLKKFVSNKPKEETFDYKHMYI